MTTKKELKEECKKLFNEIVMLRAKGRDEVYPNLKANLIHHFVPRSLCALLIFNPDNGVALDSRNTHYPHHCQFDPYIHDMIIRKRGTEQIDKLYKIRKEWQEMRRRGETDSFFTNDYYEKLRNKLWKQLKELEKK